MVIVPTVKSLLVWPEHETKIPNLWFPLETNCIYTQKPIKLIPEEDSELDIMKVISKMIFLE